MSKLRLLDAAFKDPAVREAAADALAMIASERSYRGNADDTVPFICDMFECACADLLVGGHSEPGCVLADEAFGAVCEAGTYITSWLVYAEAEALIRTGWMPGDPIVCVTPCTADDDVEMDPLAVHARSRCRVLRGCA